MKMSEEHYEALKARVKQLAPQVADHRVRLLSDPRVKDVDKRLLWDVFYATQMHTRYTVQEFNYTNAHIETAMRKIFKELLIVKRI